MNSIAPKYKNKNRLYLISTILDILLWTLWHKCEHYSIDSIYRRYCNDIQSPRRKFNEK